ncbi:MAG TPA: methylated-DNA--[protein]-cysteine S-methyltransferase [Xanthobacteraceae bacterium]|nr:methylated-DNA--[protein]-cysteine S-methyltransferase [Xanthobacteraceae bacterium]
MATPGFTLFDTAIGRCGVIWGEHGIRGVQLPEADESKTRARIRRRFPRAIEASPPPDVLNAIKAINTLLRGQPSDLRAITLDMTRVPAFERNVYEAARTISPGATLTYGELAARVGEPGAAREVGQALGHNPFAIIVPCHRVLAAGGKIGGFSANGGVATKRRLLAIEAAQAKGEPTLFDWNSRAPDPAG